MAAAVNISLINMAEDKRKEDSKLATLTQHRGQKDLFSASSYFLGDPPPDPRFLASLGALSLVGLDHCSVFEILTSWTGPNVQIFLEIVA